MALLACVENPAPIGQDSDWTGGFLGVYTHFERFCPRHGSGGLLPARELMLVVDHVGERSYLGGTGEISPAKCVEIHMPGPTILFHLAPTAVLSQYKCVAHTHILNSVSSHYFLISLAFYFLIL